MTNNAGGEGWLEIPVELRSYFSDSQAEELVSQFQQSDCDGSGSIDEREFRALLARMALSVTDAEAAELVESIDTDGSGLIDFPELLAMVVQIKKGDDRFRALKKFVDALDTTPIAVLEREAKKFGLQINYQLVDERKATSSMPAQFVMELVISGKWCGAKGAEKLQAIGKTTQEAKFKAAEAGLGCVKKLKPGLAYELGYLPPEWDKWLFDNLEKGGKVKKLLEILTQKGFSPANSISLMQRISTRVSSYRFRTRRRAPKSMYESNKSEGKAAGRISANSLHPQWVHWSQQELERGIEGRIILQELIDFGYDPEKNPLFTQTLSRTRHSSNNKPRESDCRDDDSQSRTLSGLTPAGSSNGSYPLNRVRTYTFLRCLEEGNLGQVELFVFGGQDVNAKLVDFTNPHVALAPLHVACKLEFGEIVSFLLENGAKVDLVDDFHRTPLMVAARKSYFGICEQLIVTHSASIFLCDNLSNTPLHMAAYGGCAKVVDLILRTHDEMLLLCIANLPQKRAVSYEALLETAFNVIMKAKLRENERRRFHVSWVFEAVQWTHHELILENEMAGNERMRDLPMPQKFYLDHLVERYHDKFSKKPTEAGDEDVEYEDPDQEKTDAKDWISVQEVVFYIDKCLRETFKHLMNKQGRTALHVACDENLVCTHELAIQSLVETHGCSPLFRDHSGLAPLELVLSFRGRPGSPKGDKQLEMAHINSREERLRVKKERQETERITARRQRWQQELETMARDFNDLETLAKTKALVKRLGPPQDHVHGWDVYEEHPSRNRVFANVKSGFVQRQVPVKILETSSTRLGWKEKLELHSHFVERNRLRPDWELHRVNSTDVYFFFNRQELICQWVKPSEASSEWRTKRLFDNLEQLEDEQDQASLVVVFSGKASGAITKDAARGRRLGAWRECVCFNTTFYLREGDCEEEEAIVALDKPHEVLQHESFRYAEVLIRERSEEIEEHDGGWKRYYDPVTAHTFYFDAFSGECVHETFATRSFLTGIRKPGPKSRFAKLTKDELQRRRGEEEWKAALQRVRRREESANESALQVEQLTQQSQERSEKLQKAIQKLEMSVTSEHLDVHGKGMAYVDARYRRELEIFLKAHENGLLTSMDPAHESPRDELERAITLEKELNDDERASAAIEDVDANRASRERRRVSRLLCRAVERLNSDLALCRWGCARWFPRSERSLETHERDECHRRRMVCRLGCALVLEHQQWRLTIYDHEAEQGADRVTECASRIVLCPRDCGVWVPHVHLDHHMCELCMKRPVGDLLCRLGCGQVYQGGAHELLALEQTRISHEQDDCGLRKVECTWPKCRAIGLATDRNAHRRNHLISSGVVSFLTAEVHEYKVPKDMKLLKIQAWGAGGGSGHLKGQMVGHGGGGAFVEGVCKVFPGETLYVSIGSGGNCGKYARLRQIEFEEEEDDDIGSGRTTGQETPSKKKKSRRIETFVGVAKGGFPGGGDGHSGNKESACGAGGGFTSVYRESAYGIEYLVLAAGGGGGGTCRHGDGGGAFKQRKFKDGDDVRMGQPGGDDGLNGGEAGECDEHNPICKFVGTKGGSMQGGNGAEFGGGGGGGLFGGGGGGFAPGVVGGGGGGSSFVNMELFDRKSVRVEPGDVVQPGGMDQNPPQSVRGAYWDVVDGVVGEGGTSSMTALEKGNHGGVRLARSGFFNDMKFHR